MRHLTVTQPTEEEAVSDIVRSVRQGLIKTESTVKTAVPGVLDGSRSSASFSSEEDTQVTHKAIDGAEIEGLADPQPSSFWRTFMLTKLLTRSSGLPWLPNGLLLLLGSAVIIGLMVLLQMMLMKWS
ncbi:MAG: hypothetical protein OXT67_07300 [Zetaproteobacteria bacterium]|nr:hypothetical protein [Zetaproteobacteria bacterium]